MIVDVDHNVRNAIKQVARGGMIILIDDEDRENEGDLVFSASDVCPEKINFMAKEARGLICLSLDKASTDRLQLPLMEGYNNASSTFKTAFTVSIEAKDGVTTGISAADRAHTILTAIDEQTTPQDIVVPGHVFPLIAKEGGVLERAGHTEGSVDIVKLAGKKPAAVICEILKDDGTMARLPDLQAFSLKHDIPMLSIKDLIMYRFQKENLLKIVKRAPLQTAYGAFEGVWFQSVIDTLKYFALVKGNDFSRHCTDVRVHKQLAITDVFSTDYYDETISHEEGLSSRHLVTYGLRMLRSYDHAILLYLQDNETFFPLERKEMDPRAYGIGAQILRRLGVKKMCLHVTAKRDMIGLEGFGLKVEQIKLITRDRLSQQG